MTTATPIISKSKYLSGLQCHKRLWIEYNARELLPSVDSQTQAVFDQGKEVGILAKKLYPDGIEIEGDHKDFDGLVFRTRQLLTARRPLFEASFQHGSAFARVDILVPANGNSRDIIEVKSGGEVKEVNLDDVSLQYYVCRGAGLDIRRCYVMHVNKEYVRHGKIDPAGLLTKVDVTPEILGLVDGVPDNLAMMQKVIAGPKPQNGIGPQCNDPYECPLMDQCWAFLPKDNLFTLYRFPDRNAFELLRNGIVSIRDLPPDYETTERREIQIRATLTGEVQIAPDRLDDYLSTLHYPLYFLDFETLHPAIPLYDGTRPFRHVPFQFSLHIVRSPGEGPEHHSFLAEGREDPRPQILSRLRELLGSKGSIVAYHAQFEKDRLKECCEAYPDYLGWFGDILARMVDLERPFSDFSWYHPEQLGSASMKSVLPLLTGLSYDNMEIADGEAASAEFRRVMFGDVVEEERRRVRQQLERYCGLDTFGMVRMVERLLEHV